MNILQRLEMEIKNIELSQNELIIYIEENGLNPHEQYNPQSLTAKKAIYKTALSVLESVANDITLMTNMKLDDMTVSEFSDNLASRIDQLTRTIRTMKSDSNTDIFMLYM